MYNHGTEAEMWLFFLLHNVNPKLNTSSTGLLSAQRFWLILEIDVAKIILNKIWNIFYSMSKPHLAFSGLITKLYRVQEVDFLDYYHYCINIKMDYDFVCHRSMARQYRANNISISSLTPQ